MSRLRACIVSTLVIIVCCFGSVGGLSLVTEKKGPRFTVSGAGGLPNF